MTKNKLHRKIFYRGNLYTCTIGRSFDYIVLCIQTVDSFDSTKFKGVVVQNELQAGALGYLSDFDIKDFVKYNGEPIILESYD